MFAREVASERALRIGGYDWYNPDVMDDSRQSEDFDFLRFGVIPVDGGSSSAVVNGQSRVTVYGAWNMRTDQLRRLAILRSQCGTVASFMRDRDKWDYARLSK